MSTVVLASLALSALGIALGVLTHLVLSLAGLPFSIEHIPPIAVATIFLGIGGYASQPISEAMKLLQHASLSRRAADRTAVAVYGIRDRAIGVVVFSILSASTSAIFTSFNSAGLSSNLWTLSVIAGLMVTEFLALGWLISKHREVGRFQHRLEQKKRDDEARKAALGKFDTHSAA